MKTLLTTLTLVLLFATTGFAQDEVGSASTSNAATQNYSIGDLEKFNKMELTSIYIAKLERLNNIIVYVPFAKLEPKTPNDIKIPDMKTNEKAMDSLSQTRAGYNETLKESLTPIIPYADKRSIVESIVFLQDFINKIELIGLGMSRIDY